MTWGGNRVLAIMATSTSLPSSPSVLITATQNVEIPISYATTSSVFPSAKDLLLAVPRAFVRIGSFAFVTMPEKVDSLLRLRNGGKLIAGATAQIGIETTSLGSTPVLPSLKTITTTLANGTTATFVAKTGGTGQSTFNFDRLRNVGGFFTYITSKWAWSWLFLVRFLRAHIIRAVPSTAAEGGMRPKRSARPFSMVVIYFTLNPQSEAISSLLCFLAVPQLCLVIMTLVWSLANCT